MEGRLQDCETDPPPLDAVFDLLGHAHRRRLLTCLRAADGALGLERVAAELATWEDDRSPAFVPEPEVQRIRSMLYHGHVPKLCEHGVIAYDEARGEVALRPRVEHLVPYLEEAVDREPDL